MLRIYNVSDNGSGDLHGDETIWDAYWAESPEQAERLFRERYERETGVGPDEYSVRVEDASGRLSGTKALAFAPEGPGREGRAEVLRLLGWSVEDDRQCESCGLHSMDEERFAVCDLCDRCRECGHSGDCPALAPARDRRRPGSGSRPSDWS